MFSIMQLLRWKRNNVPRWSFSALVDVQQIHVRNVYLFCFGLAMTRQFFGSNIVCQHQGDLSPEVVDTKCFINGTMTDLSFMHDPIMPVLYHDYYQWVSVVLLLMAVCFHLPYRIWSKHTSFFIAEISSSIKTIDDCTRVVKTIVDSRGDRLFWKTFALECFYLVQLICQLALLNLFFNHVWSWSGWSWTAIPLLFPEKATCSYDYFSGGVQTWGKINCLLPLNSVYRKVFWIVYCTFPVLLMMHAIFLLFRFYQAIRMGKEWINSWWCLQISKSQAETWYAKRNLEKQWENFKFSSLRENATYTDSMYVSMEEFSKPKV